MVLTRSDTGDQTPIGQGGRIIHLSGLPSELLLYLSGREADVALTGEPESVDAWQASINGL